MPPPKKKPPFKVPILDIPLPFGRELESLTKLRVFRVKIPGEPSRYYLDEEEAWGAAMLHAMLPHEGSIRVLKREGFELEWELVADEEKDPHLFHSRG